MGHHWERNIVCIKFTKNRYITYCVCKKVIIVRKDIEVSNDIERL